MMIMIVGLSSCELSEPAKSDFLCPALSPAYVKISGGEAILGSNGVYTEEFLRVGMLVDFDIDNTEVTNAQFKQFVEDTDYVTTAEKLQPGFDKAGGAVFKRPSVNNPNWWQFVEGANWKHPEGPNSTIENRDNEPVVQISLVDAKAYAEWAGRELPSEKQWEYAAKAGSETLYVWGKDRAPDGVEQANTWQGAFPIQNTQKDGFAYRAPVGCFEPNAYGLYDMIGNVWEWTATPYSETSEEWEANRKAKSDNKYSNYTIKGGSFLCAENFCARYRAPARQSQEIDFSTNHIGFRTVSKN